MPAPSCLNCGLSKKEWLASGNCMARSQQNLMEEYMNKTLALLAAAGITFAVPAFAADSVSTEAQSKTKIEKDSDGNYTKTQKMSQESTDTAGTTTSAETNVKVDIDADGESARTVKSKVVEDPKGLFNKTKTLTTDTVKDKNGVVETDHKKTVNGKTVEEEKHQEPSSTTTAH